MFYYKQTIKELKAWHSLKECIAPSTFYVKNIRWYFEVYIFIVFIHLFNKQQQIQHTIQFHYYY